MDVSRYLKDQILCHTQGSTAFIIFDALGECPEACRVPLLSVLAEVQREYGRLNVLLTWRKSWAPACEIERLLENTRAIEVHANQQELELYVTDHLPPELESRRHIIDEILAMANGRYDLLILPPIGHFGIKADVLLRYLFAKLCLELLECTLSPQNLNLISPTPNFPTTYDILYHRIMDKISLQATNRAHMAKRCLTWLAFTKRPLSVVELQDALAVFIDENADSSFMDDPADISAVTSYCSGLARLDNINGTSCIRLRDRTIEGYLHRHLSGAEDDLGRACVTFLINRSPGSACRTNKQLMERLRSNPFYKYTASHCRYHIQVTNKQVISNSTIQKFLSYRTK